MKYDKKILDSIYETQQKQNTNYIHPGSPGYTFFKVILILAFCINLYISTLSVLSYYVRNFIFLQAADFEINLIKNITINIIYIIIFLVVFIASFIVLLCKKHITGLIMGTISSIGLMIMFATIMQNFIEENGYLFYIYRHAGPLFFYFLIVLLIGIFGIRSDIKTKKAYIAKTDKKYIEQFK